MKKRIIAAVAVLILMTGTVFPVFASPTRIELGVELTATAAIIVNEDTGRVIYEKNADKRIAPASTTKIMSAALAMTMCDDLENTMVTAPYDLWVEFDGIDISSAGIHGGETMSMIDLIHCMLLCSANEAASIVADYFGREQFIEAMNRKAKELGCTGTHFVNPHGLDESEHYTTARDLYLITDWAMSVPGFSDIVSLSSYTLHETNIHSERDIYTTIQLQSEYSGYYTRYIKGIKTGTTDDGGRCLVTRGESGGMTFTSIIMGCPMEIDTRIWEEGQSAFTNTRLALDWCFDHTAVTEIVKRGTPVSETTLKYAKHKDYLMLYASESVSTILQTNTGEDPVIIYETEIPESVDAPIASGQVIGTAKVFSDGMYIGDIDLIALEDIEKSYFIYYMDVINRILTSRTAIVVYGVFLVLASVYCYYMLVVVKRKENEMRKRAEERRQRESQEHTGRNRPRM